MDSADHKGFYRKGRLPQHQAHCTKETPWDGKTLPVLHVDADFIDDLDILHCPNCKHTWSLGPDL